MSESVSRGRGRGGSRGGVSRGHSARPLRSSAVVPSSLPEGEQDESLLSIYGKQLSLLSEIYPSWKTQDLLFTLKDANGDMELAISRITEGQAQQWDSVKSKKSKQLQRQQQQQQDTTAPPAASNRGTTGRGRADSRGRGLPASRGGARGRGGRGVATQESGPNGHSMDPPLPSSDPISTTATTGSATPSGPWAGWGAPSPAPPAPVAATNAEGSGWGDEPQVNGNASEHTESTTVEEPQKAETPAVAPPAAPKPAAKRPAGATLSWAQIAKPAEVAKAIQAQVALPTPPPVQKQSVPAPEHETRPTLDEQDDEQVIVEPTTKPVNDPWASTPAASVVSAFPNQPLGVGEGWAETVLSNSQGDEVAANQQAYHHAAGSPNLQNALPPNGTDPAGPIEVSESADTYEQPTTELNAGNNSVASQLEDQVEAQQHERFASAASTQSAASVGPPGFAHKPAKEQGAIAGNVDRIGVQFGSLGLFDQAAPATQPAEQAPAARSPEVQERQSYSTASQAAQPASVSQGIPAGPFAGYPQFGGAPSAQAGYGAFAGQIDQYQLHQQQLGQLPNGPAAAQRSAEPSPFPGQQQHVSAAPSASPYASLGDTQQSAYFQAHAAPASTPQQQPAQQLPSSYAAFHSVQAQQQPQAGQYGQNDYAHLYGMQQRPGGVPSAYGQYSNYSEQAAAQAAQAAYGRQSAGVPDDKQQQAQGAPGAPAQTASPMGQQHPANYPQGYGYPYYYGGGYGAPYSAPSYQQSPYAAYQYGQSNMQGLGQRPGGYQQQQQPSVNAGYGRGSIPAPANYGQQQGFYQAYPQQQTQQSQGQERDRSSYKNTGFPDY